jgi:steroid 5-alpha reductase family enzyme
VTGLLWSLAAVVALFVAGWIASLIRRDAGLADWLWGPGFVVVAFVHVEVTGLSGNGRAAFLLAVTLWGLRLAAHMVARADGHEDARYAAMRRRHGDDFALRSLFIVFLLQAVILWVVAIPVHVALRDTAPVWLPALVWAGLALFAAGFVLETVADRQLLTFRRDPARRGTLLTAGLFSVVRHPNYLGEIIAWTGLGLAAFGISGSPLALAGPALLAFLIVKVSGLPLLEAHLSKRSGWADYAARVPALLPWPKTPTGRPGGAPGPADGDATAPSQRR